MAVIEKKRAKTSSVLDTEPLYIADETTYKEALAIINAYLDRMQGDESKLSHDEHCHFRALALGIESYERERYPIPTRQELIIQDFTVSAWDSVKLRQFRLEFNFSEAELGELLGVSAMEIVRMEKSGDRYSRMVEIALDRVEAYIREALHG